MERPLVLTAPTDPKYGTVHSLAATQQAYDHAWECYQDCMNVSGYTHENALMTAEAILINNLTTMFNKQAEGVEP